MRETLRAIIRGCAIAVFATLAAQTNPGITLTTKPSPALLGQNEIDVADCADESPANEASKGH